MDGKLTATWDQTAFLAAEIRNARFGAKSAVSPRDVNPYKREERESVAVDTALAKMFGIEIPHG